MEFQKIFTNIVNKFWIECIDDLRLHLVVWLSDSKEKKTSMKFLVIGSWLLACVRRFRHKFKQTR